jgi:hypothetical protein
MPYVFSMTARMATIAACCVLLLCVLLFLLGVELGARYAAPASTPGTSVAPTAIERAPSPASPDAGASALPAVSASNAS